MHPLIPRKNSHQYTGLRSVDQRDFDTPEKTTCQLLQPMAQATKAELSTFAAIGHTRGMNKFLCTVILFGFAPLQAQAAACMSYEAAYNLEMRINEGMGLKDALQSVIDEEYSDGSKECLRAIKQELNQTPYAFPKAYKLLFNRNIR